MRLRWPEGFKGWGFAGEIAIIVAGVLIALGAQQLVERSNDRERADLAIAALKADVGDIDFTASEIQIAAPCIQAQLENIREKLVRNDRNLLERQTRNSWGDFVVRTPSRVWPTDTWQSISNSEALRRTAPELDRQMASLFSQVDGQRERNERVHLGTTELKALSVMFPENQAERLQLVMLIERIRGEVSLMDLVAGQLRDRMAAAESLLDDKERDRRLGESGTLKFCREKGLLLGKLRPAIAANAD